MKDVNFGNTAKIIGLVALGLGGYKLLQKFGVLKSQDDVINEQAGDVTTVTGRAWSGNFWQQFNWSQSKENQIYNIALPAAKVLKNDVFGVWSDDFSKAFNTIKQFKTKAEISLLVDVFNYEYNLDLQTFLANGDGWIGDGFNDENLAKINNYVSKLPNN